MTDHTDDPTDLTDRQGAGEADARWFRHAVGPVLDRERVPDAWAAIRDRASGAAPPAVPLRPTGRGARPARRWMGAAAAVLVVAAIAGAAVVARDGDDATDLATDGTTAPSSTAAPATTPTGPPTGFYVPQDLPDGWTVDAVLVRHSGTGGVVSRRLWVDAAGTRSVDVEVVTAVYAPNAEAEQVDLGGGQTGGLLTGPNTSAVAWADGDRVVGLVANGLDRDEVLAAARQVATDPASDRSPVTGLDLFSSSPPPPSGVAAVPIVTVELTTPAGHRFGYDVTLPGSNRWLSGTRILERTLVGAPAPVVEVTRDDELPWMSDDTATTRFGLWPGADIAAPARAGTDRLANPTAAELDTLFAALRPTDAAGWQAFVTSAADHQPSAIGPDLASLSVGRLEDAIVDRDGTRASEWGAEGTTDTGGG